MKERYEELYKNMNNGVYNGLVRSFEKGLKPSSEILVRKVKKACVDKGVSFDDFLIYAKKRRKNEEKVQ